MTAPPHKVYFSQALEKERNKRENREKECSRGISGHVYIGGPREISRGKRLLHLIMKSKAHEDETYFSADHMSVSSSTAKLALLLEEYRELKIPWLFSPRTNYTDRTTAVCQRG
jgi:hypothetical protein